MVMMKNNQVGDDNSNMLTSARLPTLFAEVIVMPQPWRSSFSSKLQQTKRGQQTLPVYYQTVPTNGTLLYVSPVTVRTGLLNLRCIGYLNRLLELSTIQNRNGSCCGLV